MPCCRIFICPSGIHVCYNTISLLVILSVGLSKDTHFREISQNIQQLSIWIMSYTILRSLRMHIDFRVVILMFKVTEVTKVKFGFWGIMQNVLELSARIGFRIGFGQRPINFGGWPAWILESLSAKRPKITSGTANPRLQELTTWNLVNTLTSSPARWFWDLQLASGNYLIDFALPLWGDGHIMPQLVVLLLTLYSIWVI